MPIKFTKEDGFQIYRPTKEEEKAIMEIGKRMIVEGLSGAYTNEKYKKWLEQQPLDKFFNA